MYRAWIFLQLLCHGWLSCDPHFLYLLTSSKQHSIFRLPSYFAIDGMQKCEHTGKRFSVWSKESFLFSWYVRNRSIYWWYSTNVARMDNTLGIILQKLSRILVTEILKCIWWAPWFFTRNESFPAEVFSFLFIFSFQTILSMSVDKTLSTDDFSKLDACFFINWLTDHVHYILHTNKFDGWQNLKSNIEYKIILLINFKASNIKW